MLSREENDRLTRTGAGTPAGTVLRRYWQPIALVDELSSPRPVKAVRALGQDFVLFRDQLGGLGLLDRDCPHRNADLAFGRLEDGGLRCLFHGWLFDTGGRCLETPGEPPRSRICSTVRQRAYPVQVVNGIIFAYLGDGAPPALPALDCFIAPESHVFAFKGHLDCNWLQALEVGLDPAHASFLHRFFEDEQTSNAYGRQFRAASSGSERPMTEILRLFPQPDIRVEHSDIGLRITALRELGDGQTHIRVTNLLFPQAFVIPMSAEMTISQWHVPIDDTRCYWYALFTSFGAPVDKDVMRRQGWNSTRCPTICRGSGAATIMGSAGRSNRPGPIPEWVRTSTCTTNGPSSRRAASRTVRANTWASPTRRSSPIAGCSWPRSGRPLPAHEP